MSESYADLRKDYGLEVVDGCNAVYLYHVAGLSACAGADKTVDEMVDQIKADEMGIICAYFGTLMQQPDNEDWHELTKSIWYAGLDLGYSAGTWITLDMLTGYTVDDLGEDFQTQVSSQVADVLSHAKDQPSQSDLSETVAELDGHDTERWPAEFSGPWEIFNEATEAGIADAWAEIEPPCPKFLALAKYLGIQHHDINSYGEEGPWEQYHTPGTTGRYYLVMTDDEANQAATKMINDAWDEVVNGDENPGTYADFLADGLADRGEHLDYNGCEGEEGDFFIYMQY